ncbi:hypothetical protein Tco_0822666 [Tanacetum coccineum]|uniref:Uncharacterized protein n=1 Tax=Tanacetum coccineum TaxID=301880 RepID=A0ABQ5AJ09_9ASTR
MREVGRFKEAHAPEVASYASVENSKLVICANDHRQQVLLVQFLRLQVQQCQNNQPMRHNEQPIEPLSASNDGSVPSTTRPIPVQQCQNNRSPHTSTSTLFITEIEKNQEERDKFTKLHQDKKSMLLSVSEEEISKSSGCLAAIFLYIRENCDVVAVARDALTPLLALASSSVLTNSF